MDGPQNHGSELRGDDGPPRGRGRPPGSVSLSTEIEQTIIAYTRAGAFASAAAEAAGVPVRTFHEWMARGEGRHPCRPCTPKLRAFARNVRQAHAEARVAAEIEVHKERPSYWLAHAARTKPDRDGWTKPPEGADGEDASRVPTLEERLAAIDRRREEDARRAAATATSDCPDARCACPFHQRRYFDELDRSHRRHSD
jgi:hypothetical protein